MEKQLYLSTRNKKVFGVCGGIGEYFNIDATVVRIIWLLFIFLGGTGIIPYIIACLLMPKEPKVY